MDNLEMIRRIKYCYVNDALPQDFRLDFIDSLEYWEHETGLTWKQQIALNNVYDKFRIDYKYLDLNS